MKVSSDFAQDRRAWSDCLRDALNPIGDVGSSCPAFASINNTLVRPHLWYAMQACSPNHVAEANCLEQIQRLATRLVKGFRRLPYKERLRRLGLHSLNRRRLRGDLIAVYNMFS